MAGDEAMKIVMLKTEGVQVVPDSHVLTGSGQPGDLAKDLQQAIIIEVLEKRVILLELPFHRTVEQLDVGVGKGAKRGVDGDRTLVHGSQGRKCASRISGGSGSGGGFEKSSAVDTKIHAKLFLSTRTGLENVYCHQIHPREGYLSTAFPGNFSLGRTNLERFLTELTAPAVSCFGCPEIVYRRRPRRSGMSLVEEPNEAFLHT